MRIDEIFDNPYPWKWIDNRKMLEKMLSVKVAASTLGSISLAKHPDRPSKVSSMLGPVGATFKVEDDAIWVLFEHDGPKSWTVNFDSANNRMSDHKEFQNTEAGHPGRVLATVIDIIEDFLVSYEPQVLHFKAMDNKRASIYKTILNRIKQYNRFKGSVALHGNKGHQFTLKKYI